MAPGQGTARSHRSFLLSARPTATTHCATCQKGRPLPWDPAPAELAHIFPIGPGITPKPSVTMTLSQNG